MIQRPPVPGRDGIGAERYGEDAPNHGHAERKGVTLCLEMLNSRVNLEMKGHPDYFCHILEMINY